MTRERSAACLPLHALFVLFAALPAAAAAFNTTVIQIANPSPAPDERFGGSVASIADLNGDGTSDIIIGAPGADRVYVLSGADRSVIREIGDPDGLTGNDFGFAVAAPGDMNGDGVPDLAVTARGVPNLLPIPCPVEPCPPPSPGLGRAFLFSGSSGSLIRRLSPPSPIEFAAFGFSVAALGDINADGVGDVAVGSPTLMNNKFGQVFAFSGATGAMLWLTATAPEEIASFGTTLASVSDLNNDGKRDLIVGEAFYSEGPAFIGRAFVLSGATGSTIRFHDHPLGAAGKLFSFSACGAGDQNGDGKEDYAIGDPQLSVVYLFSGATGASLGEIDSPSGGTTDYFGMDLASSDDRDGDGKRELWAGAPAGGAVYLVKTNGALLLTITDPTAGAPVDVYGFGWALDATPNLGGDAKGDLLIGEGAHQSEEGRAYVALIQENRPPVANAGADQTVECSGAAGTSVTLDGSASTDPDGDKLSYTWRDSANEVVGNTATVQLSLALGTHTFTLTVDDGFGGVATDSVTVVVQDTTEPSISVTLTPNVLGPPNHRLVLVAASIEAGDGCGAVSISLLSIESNEVDNGLGDGDAPGDIQGAALNTDDREFQLRAERAGGGTGRIYKVTYVATDGSGNTATASATVTVPH